MCRLIPARVVRIEGDNAWLDCEGQESMASLRAVDGVQVGDFVACHAGMVLERLAPEDAEALRAILAEIESVS